MPIRPQLSLSLSNAIDFPLTNLCGEPSAAYASSSRRLLEALDGESKRLITMIALEFPRDMNPLSNQVDACCERLPLRSPGQSKCVLHSRNVKFQENLMLGQNPVHLHEDLGC